MPVVTSERGTVPMAFGNVTSHSLLWEEREFGALDHRMQ